MKKCHQVESLGCSQNGIGGKDHNGKGWKNLGSIATTSLESTLKAQLKPILVTAGWPLSRAFKELGAQDQKAPTCMGLPDKKLPHSTTVPCEDRFLFTIETISKTQTMVCVCVCTHVHGCSEWGPLEQQ